VTDHPAQIIHIDLMSYLDHATQPSIPSESVNEFQRCVVAKNRHPGRVYETKNPTVSDYIPTTVHGKNYR